MTRRARAARERGETAHERGQRPPRAVLRKGARYSFLGYSPTPHLVKNPGSSLAPSADNGPILALGASSPLRALLCGSGGDEPCVYRSEIVLESNLACDGVECAVEKPRTVGIVDADGSTEYFEYVPPPCTHMICRPPSSRPATARRPRAQ